MQPTLKCGRPNPEYFGQDREEIPIGFADRVTRDVPRATMEKARARRDAILADYSDVAEEAMRCLEEGFESAMTVLHLDEYLRRYYRTSPPWNVRTKN